MKPSLPQPEDELVFLDESAPASPAPRHGASVWRVLVIDDDPDVHSATVFALGNLEMQHRTLHFLHAYSAAEARELLLRERDIAVILLDVVMEREDAGLQLVRFIREQCGMTETRIILRTGQPGYAPEIDAIRDFDINDYKTKSELTRTKLFTTMTAAIRSYEQIRAINASRRGLEMIVRASTELMARHGLADFAAGVITQIAGLLGLDPEGLLCVQENPDGQGAELHIIAAAGNYRGFINRPLSVLGDERVAAALGQALASRGNVYGGNYTALHFVGKSKRHFAAFLNTGMALSEIDQRLLEVFCSNIAVGLDNVLLVSRLHQFAFYDSLTKLPNRTRLMEILNERLTTPALGPTTLALVDIDHFSETNDALGHQFGDALLLAVAARLQAHADGGLVVARVGGDVFGVLGDAALVDPAALRALFAAPFSIDGEQVRLSATAGLVHLKDYDGTGTDALKDGEIALKRAKQHQRAGHVYFTRSMASDISERVRMMHALRAAYEKRQLFVVYQPQVELARRRPIGAEALLRWKLADGSLVAPDYFIRIAESSGLIVELGEMVLREACSQLVRLRALGLADFTMSVNVSQAQFHHPQFFDTLSRALDDSRAPPHALELEITESMAMQEPAQLIKLLEQIKQLGVNIAIDDFGTGFSSLSYLQQLNVDRLKIDRAFVSEITRSSRGSSIAEMVIQLGRNLGLQVIAEGVEDEMQASILAGLGCPQAQGYLFARPMPADQIAAWLSVQR